MPQRNSPPSILVLGSDLGFMLALSQELCRRQIAVIPSRSVREAQSLLTELRLSLDLLLINCSRPRAWRVRGRGGEGPSAREDCRHCFGTPPLPQMRRAVDGSLSRSGRSRPGTDRLLRECHRGAGEGTRTPQSVDSGIAEARLKHACWFSGERRVHGSC